jgi:phosphoserine aminotransferase
MISFYPGPSRVHDEIPRYVKEAYKLGILSINHRSPEFVKMSEKTIRLVKQKLNIPKNYTIFFTSSATECWEIIAQSLVTGTSYHLYNGAFGEKWFDYTRRIHPGATPLPFGMNESPDTELLLGKQDGIICITQNETSNGTQVSNTIIQKIGKNNPGCLIAIDATSSMGGVVLNFKAADIWFASVQKCFGLPAGLGILVCSPKALEKATAVSERKHYNSLTFMMEMMAKWQTPCTPNVLAIYLLMRVIENVKPIKVVDRETKERYQQWVSFFDNVPSLHHLVENKSVHSYTVLPITASEEQVERVKRQAKKHGFLLGEGYGDRKKTTFRIANFPAIKKKEIKSLMDFLKSLK